MNVLGENSSPRNFWLQVWLACKKDVVCLQKWWGRVDWGGGVLWELAEQALILHTPCSFPRAVWAGELGRPCGSQATPHPAFLSQAPAQPQHMCCPSEPGLGDLSSVQSRGALRVGRRGQRLFGWLRELPWASDATAGQHGHPLLSGCFPPGTAVGTGKGEGKLAWRALGPQEDRTGLPSPSEHQETGSLVSGAHLLASQRSFWNFHVAPTL